MEGRGCGSLGGGQQIGILDLVGDRELAKLLQDECDVLSRRNPCDGMRDL